MDRPAAQSTRLAAELGCAFDAEGTVQTGENESTDVPGLFAAGDVLGRRPEPAPRDANTPPSA